MHTYKLYLTQGTATTRLQRYLLDIKDDIYLLNRQRPQIASRLNVRKGLCSVLSRYFSLTQLIETGWLDSWEYYSGSTQYPIAIPATPDDAIYSYLSTRFFTATSTAWHKNSTYYTEAAALCKLYDLSTEYGKRRLALLNKLIDDIASGRIEIVQYK